MVEMYAWVQRLQRILKKIHVSVFKGMSEKKDAVEMQGPFERKNMPPISMEIVQELNVIGRKDYDKDLIFQSFEIDKRKSSKYNEEFVAVGVTQKEQGIHRITSDKASDGESDKVEFTKTKKERELDDKILETVSIKKPLLKYRHKVLNDNVHGFYFARRLELQDMIEDHNNGNPYEEEPGSSSQVDE